MDDHVITQVYALSSVSFISLAPVIILYLLPIGNKVNLERLVALAAGCLLGDAFLHLIPEASGHHTHHDHHGSDTNSHNEHEHGHHHEHHGHSHGETVGSKVLVGILIFFILEKFIYLLKSDNNSNGAKSSKAKKKKDDDYHGHDHDHMKASGILNLIADFLHNFTDGLAIGASFLAGTRGGVSTTLAIFLHEVPHEIGDYAILIQSGFSRKQAIWLQVVTAIGAISGTILSLMLGIRYEGANKWILPLTAGGFIYIATVHLIPQLTSSNIRQTVVQLMCFCIGVGIMYMMALLE